MKLILMFHRINLAKCAMDRANQHLTDPDRYNAEWDTARLWVKYHCCITTADHSYVEAF